MTTVAQALSRAEKILSKAASDSPSLSAEVLLAYALGTSRLQVLLDRKRSVPPAALTVFDRLVRRRARKEPLAYLIGEKEFFGLSFAVDPRVLIPRPETEELIEQILQRVPEKDGLCIADIGTGSGVLAVTLAKLLPNSRILAVDVDRDALHLAGENAAEHQVCRQISLVCGDLCSMLAPNSRFDFIVSNPPYVSLDEYRMLDIGVREYEPEIALVAGATGLEAGLRLAEQAKPLIAPHGFLALEIGWQQGPSLVSALSADWNAVELKKDLSGHDRFVFARP